MGFNYKNDVNLELEGKSYTVQDLLDLSEEDFTQVYEQYEAAMTIMGEQMDESKGKGFLFINYSFMMQVMEAVVLERRIRKLEA